MRCLFRLVSRMRLLGYRELAVRWSQKPNTVRQWKARGLLPTPDVTQGYSPLWLEETIRRVEDEGGPTRTFRNSS